MRASFGKTCWRTGLAFVFVSTGTGATRVAAQEPAKEAELRSEMATAERLLGKTPDRGSVLYVLAALHAQLGELHESATILKECVALKEGFDPAGGPEFAVLKGSREPRGTINSSASSRKRKRSRR